MGQVIRMIVVGLIVGILARFFYPGPVAMGWIGSIVLGIAGSFAASFAANAFSSRASAPLAPAGCLASVIGAMVLILIARLLHINI